MLPYLRIGPFLLQLPGLALLLGVWVGSSLAEKQARRLRLSAEAVYNLIFIALIVGLAGARLGYAAQYAAIYRQEPLQIFSLKPQTLSLPAGLAAALLTAYLYTMRKGLPLRPTLDALAPGLAAFWPFLGLAHLLSGDAFGRATSLPWAIYLWDAPRHPTQVYEILLAVAVLLVVLGRVRTALWEGETFLLTVALMAAARLFLDGFRGDSPLTTGGLRIPQLDALFILLLTWGLWSRWTQAHHPKDFIHE
ncbi:MAG: prolipoprotein diacylglyceryl transferase [Anaerolineales bacterium]